MNIRKFFLLCTLCLISFALQAQRCAVLEFKAGSGISQHDVDGISAIFTTYFRPAGYTMVERTQIDRVIDEQRFQRSCLTESQMVRIGKLLNVSKIVVGDINVVMRQYNVDVRVINVETGTIAATEGATFASSTYRTNMQNLAQKLAAKIAITPGRTVSPNPPATRTEPYIVHGYLKVFPYDLGYYNSEPLTIIAETNLSHKYGYDTWRLPTNAELALMRCQNIVSTSNYMTRESPRGNLRLVTEREKTPTGYVDLGLPSGTLWKDKDEIGSYSYDDAVRSFSGNLPSKEQFQELKEKCRWTMTDNGYKVTGPNNNCIILAVSGFRSCDGSYSTDVGTGCYYWSSSASGSGFAWRLKAIPDDISVSSYYSCTGYSIRLVK